MMMTMLLHMMMTMVIKMLIKMTTTTKMNIKMMMPCDADDDDRHHAGFENRALEGGVVHVGVQLGIDDNKGDAPSSAKAALRRNKPNKP